MLAMILVAVVNADWNDDFDSYPPGGLHGLGGWAGSTIFYDDLAMVNITGALEQMTWAGIKNTAR